MVTQILQAHKRMDKIKLIYISDEFVRFEDLSAPVAGYTNEITFRM